MVPVSTLFDIDLVSTDFGVELRRLRVDREGACDLKA